MLVFGGVAILSSAVSIKAMFNGNSAHEARELRVGRIGPSDDVPDILRHPWLRAKAFLKQDMFTYIYPPEN